MSTRSVALVRSALPALVVVAFAATALLAASGPTGRADAAPASPAGRVSVGGRPWLLVGGQLRDDACAVGCGGAGAARRRSNQTTVHRLVDAGAHVVRAPVLSRDAHQLLRSDGRPTGDLAPDALRDLDDLVRTADGSDAYLVLSLLDGRSAGTAHVPAAWFADPAARAGLGRLAGTLAARYADDPHVLAWELVDTPEAATDAGRIPTADLQATVAAMATAVSTAAPIARTTVLAADVTRLPTWRPYVTFASAAWDAAARPSGPTCAGCSPAAAVGGGLPVLVSRLRAGSGTQLADATRALVAQGYAGSIGDLLGSSTSLTAARALVYARTDTGPRVRPLNPCTGPDAARYACPNLRMSPPRNISLLHRGSKLLLAATNSINNVGRGPAQLDGVRSSPTRMRANQRLHLRSGRGAVTVATQASLFWKAIPGQGHYWKWDQAARFELWRLDASGEPTELVRTGPKQVYCLRDLKHTRPGEPRSPHGQVYPGCSQSYGERRRTLGTSVGWSDVYPATYFQNWVDVTGLRGCFAYVHVVDPENGIAESDEWDDAASTTVRLPFRGGAAGCPGARPTSPAFTPTPGYD